MRVVGPFFIVLCFAGTAHAQNIQKADFVFSVNSPGWVLAQGTGDRYFTESIIFDTIYDTPPAIVVILNGFDATTDKDVDDEQKPESVRIYLAPEKITKTGFVLRIKTWGDSKLGAVWGTWMAWSK